MFRLQGEVWTYQQLLSVWGATSAQWMGVGMQLHAPWLAIGAEEPTGSGSVATFMCNEAMSQWVQTQRIYPDPGQTNARFAYQVAMRDGVMVAGAYNQDAAGGAHAGRAFAFGLNQTSLMWKPQQTLSAFDGQAGAAFGYT